MGNGESLQPGSPRNPSASQIQPLTYNGHRVSRRWEDDYVDIGSEMEAISREEMEDEFKKIVVRFVIYNWPFPGLSQE